MVPPTMQAILLQEPGGPLTFGTVPTPQPGPGQVLIRMAAAPINPSDLGFVKGSYGFQKPFPVVPGFEGSGTVIAAGPGLLPRLLVGRRVACSASQGGTWAEYLVAPVTACIPLPRHLPLEEGATLIVNPLTALAFLEVARREKHAAIVNNAAAGALGQMILRLGLKYQIPITHIVRRVEQVDLLRSLGGEYVLNSSAPGFEEELHLLSHQLNATLILDPVGGERAHKLLEAVPNGSTLVMYGSLSEQRFEPVLLESMFGNKRVETFFLPDWMAKKHLGQMLMKMWRVRRLAGHELKTTIQRRLPLGEVEQGLALYQTNPTAGKVLLVADQEKVPVGNQP